MKQFKLISILACSIFLGGCLQQKPLEELGLVTAMGYDKEDELLRGTIVYYEFDPLHTNDSKMVSTLSNTSKGIRQKENLSSSRKLVSGQLRIAIYGEELAKEGIIAYIDTLSRDSEVGTMVYLSVAENSAYELIHNSQQSEEITNVGTYLYDLISQNVEAESLVSPTLHEFMQCYYSEGRDPVLPLLDFSDDTLRIKGLALFKDDKMQGSIDTDKSFYLKLLLDPYRAGTIEISLPKNDMGNHIKKREQVQNKAENLFVSLDHLESSVDIKLEDAKANEYSIKVDVVTRMQEISEDYDLGNPKALIVLEKAISKVMERKMEKIIAEFQSLGVDPIGFGNYYRSKVGYEKFSRDKWQGIYPGATFNIEVKTKILRTGVMD
ncbi:spore germination protein [Bacillus tianshenii]|uniref:Spore germination protein n=1 Tax=Sutcliffiella tianshenii TaxID=1463404 RepID=A0ABS2NXL9_9BACI|nr:Ger(x)C family spore germination protein [Bacillus tianshenii]MBM7619422.1 spore germination protein [Bacillus tianshenii]